MLFIMLVDTISQDVVRSELSWELLYADDLAITDITSTDIQNRLQSWHTQSEGMRGHNQTGSDVWKRMLGARAMMVNNN